MRAQKNKIIKAIFPVAGLGTRFLPVTKSTPKEMLPIIDKPLIQCAVEEAYEAGIREMIFVTGRNKRAIEDHFDLAYELNSVLHEKHQDELMRIVDAIKPADMFCVYVRQLHALGLGHAVLCARHLIDDEPFAVLLADDFMVGSPNVLSQMVEEYHHYQCSIVAAEHVALEKTHLYGVLSGVHDVYNSKILRIDGFVEKPKPGTAPSCTAIVGRYILTPKIFDFIDEVSHDDSSEIQLTDALIKLMDDEPIMGYLFDGERYDCGSKLGWLQANINSAMKNATFAEPLLNWLEQHPLLKQRLFK